MNKVNHLLATARFITILEAQSITVINWEWSKAFLTMHHQIWLSQKKKWNLFVHYVYIHTSNCFNSLSIIWIFGVNLSIENISSCFECFKLKSKATSCNQGDTAAFIQLSIGKKNLSIMTFPMRPLVFTFISPYQSMKSPAFTFTFNELNEIFHKHKSIHAILVTLKIYFVYFYLFTIQ